MPWSWRLRPQSQTPTASVALRFQRWRTPCNTAPSCTTSQATNTTTPFPHSIKSVRGSDPDAAVYWLSRMIEAGEDPMFIARRLVILAAEDVGMADPQGLPVAVAAQQAVHFVGMPEGAIPLAEATVYLATAPKSNSAYAALNRAREDARRTRNEPVPLHLRNAVTPLMKAQGYADGYRYAHDYPGHFAPMNNLPSSVGERRYYEPSDQGYERTVAQRLSEWWDGERGRTGVGGSSGETSE